MRRGSGLELGQDATHSTLHVDSTLLSKAPDPGVELRPTNQDLAPDAVMGQGVRGVIQAVPELPYAQPAVLRQRLEVQEDVK